MCKPKPNSHLNRKYNKLEFFVKRELHLPSRIVITKSDGLEVNTADFPDLSERSLNAGITRKAFKPPAAWKRYKEVVETLDQPPPDAP